MAGVGAAAEFARAIVADCAGVAITEFAGAVDADSTGAAIADVVGRAAGESSDPDNGSDGSTFGGDLGGVTNVGFGGASSVAPSLTILTPPSGSRSRCEPLGTHRCP